MNGKRRLGKYVLLAETGRCGLGIEYRAAQLGSAGLERIVALFRVHDSFATSADLVGELTRRVRGSTSLQHAGIVRTLGVGRVAGAVYFTHELVDGKPLRDVMSRVRERGRPLTSALALSIASQVSAALEYAHGRRLDAQDSAHHGLVTPWNVVVTYDGDAYLRGFGCWSPRLLNSGAVDVEDRSFIAPEQRRTGTASARGDVFAVGALLIYVATGRVPREATTIDDVDLGLIAAAGMDPVATSAMTAILKRALNPDPDARYADMASLRRALDEARFESAPSTTQSLGRIVRGLFEVEMERESLALREERTANYFEFLTDVDTALASVGRSSAAGSRFETPPPELAPIPSAKPLARPDAKSLSLPGITLPSAPGRATIKRVSEPPPDVDSLLEKTLGVRPSSPTRTKAPRLTPRAVTPPPNAVALPEIPAASTPQETPLPPIEALEPATSMAHEEVRSRTPPPEISSPTIEAFVESETTPLEVPIPVDEVPPEAMGLAVLPSPPVASASDVTPSASVHQEPSSVAQADDESRIASHIEAQSEAARGEPEGTRPARTEPVPAGPAQSDETASEPFVSEAPTIQIVPPATTPPESAVSETSEEPPLPFVAPEAEAQPPAPSRINEAPRSSVEPAIVLPRLHEPEVPPPLKESRPDVRSSATPPARVPPHVRGPESRTERAGAPSLMLGPRASRSSRRLIWILAMVIIVVGILVSAVIVIRSTSTPKAPPPSTMSPAEIEAQQRVRELEEQLRAARKLRDEEESARAKSETRANRGARRLAPQPSPTPNQ